MSIIKKYRSYISKILMTTLFICSIFKCDMNVFASSAGDKYIDGYIIYNNALYSKGHYNEDKSRYSFNGLKSIKLFFPKSTMSIIPVPMSQIMIEDVKNLNNPLSSQSQFIDKMRQEVEGTNIKIIDVCDTFLKHKNEYLYCKYDHHWQSLGAYYAYKDFCEENGLECDDISEYRKVVLNENYRGGAYKKIVIHDKSIEEYGDVLTAYIASVSNVMKIYDESNRIISNGKPCINEKQNAYWGAYLTGDHPWTVIDSKIDKNKTALVIKDSFGCCFVPYLVSNYNKVYVVDPRFASFNIVEKMKGIKIDDIIVVCANYTLGQANFYNGIENILPKA